MRSQQSSPGVSAPALATRQSVRTGFEEDTIAAALEDKLHFDLAIPFEYASRHDWFMALALVVRDRLLDRYLRTLDIVVHSPTKVVAYLSAEFLMGPQLGNNLL